MEEKSLACSFGDSLSEEVSGCVGEYIEVGLDSIMEDGILKDIPFISTVISLYKIGKSVHECHHVKKMATFLNEIHNRVADETDRVKYREKFQGDEKFRNQELEYIMIIIDRYIGYEKPKMLAKLYLAYLDGTIIWEEFTMYAEVIDRFLPQDCRTLVMDSFTFHTRDNVGAESILRLVALGLMAEDNSVSITKAQKTLKGESRSASQISRDSKMKTYKRTEFGRKLADILR